MTDQRFTELLSRKLSGEISAEDDREFMLILAENEDYRLEYESLNIYFQQDEQPYDNIAQVFQHIKERISQTEAVPSAEIPAAPAKRSFPLWYRIAAIFILGICAFAVYQLLPSKTSGWRNTAVAWKKLNTSAGHKSGIVLADGTRVTLNAESELSYPAAFGSRTRDIYLSGEAFFDVAKDHKHPFIVHTETMSISVLGTAFDVKSYKNEPLTETTLLRGKIQITLNNRPEKQILLNPAEKFTLIHAADGKPGQLKSAAYSITPMTYYNAADKNTIIETSWMNDKLMFKNETFDMLSLRFARWYGVNFIFKSEELKADKFSGLFEKESLAEALKALQLITPFQYKIQGKTVYLYRSNQ